MQDEHLSFWSFPITFRVLHYTGNKAFTVNQDFIKDIWENQVIGFSSRRQAQNIIFDKYKCIEPPSFKCNRYKVGWRSKQFSHCA